MRKSPDGIDAVFRSSRNNEAYFFVNDKYVLMDYAPGTSKERILYGPSPICDGFKSLAHTIFGNYGIDCAVNIDFNEALIFYENFCSRVDYAPYSGNFRIVAGPKKTADMFTVLKGTVFEDGIDAAFKSTTKGEVYIFKGDKYSRFFYDTNSFYDNIATFNLSEGFPFLRGTVFENGIDAAFASHKTNEVYFFKEEFCARVSYTAGSSNNQIIGGVNLIRDYWKNLCDLIYK